MIKIQIGKVTERDPEKLIDENVETPASFIEHSKYAGLSGDWMLDGDQLSSEDKLKTFSQLGYGAERDFAHLFNIPYGKNG